MYKKRDKYIFSPSDLSRYMDSPFASWMDRYSLEYPQLSPAKDHADALAASLQKRGYAHEDTLEAEFRERGLSVEKIVAEYIQDGEAAKANIIEEAKAAAEKLQEQAKKNIEHEFQKAKQQLKAEMAEQAVAMAEELIKKHITDEDQERTIDEYLTKVVVAQ